MLAAVVDCICFKALQLFGSVQHGLVCLSIAEAVAAVVHASILRHHSLGSSGYGDRGQALLGGRGGFESQTWLPQRQS